MRLWFHETQRVYGDKLIDEKDIESFSKLQLDILKKNVEEIDESAVLEKPNIYCHFAGKYFLRKMSHRVSRLIIILSRLRFLNKLPRVVTAIAKNEWRKRFEGGVGEPKYMAVKDWSTLHRLLSEAMVSYNDLVAAMKLVLFEDAMMHVCRINRILESPRGSALLVGVGGSGKQSLSRLAAFISSLEVFQIQLKKGYGIADMKSELAALYNKSGLKNLGIVFLMTDAQVANEQFLVLINDMLASGEVPDLFAEDELENIIAGCWTNISLYRCIFHPLPHPRIETILLIPRKSIPRNVGRRERRSTIVSRGISPISIDNLFPSSPAKERIAYYAQFCRGAQRGEGRRYSRHPRELLEVLHRPCSPPASYSSLLLPGRIHFKDTLEEIPRHNKLHGDKLVPRMAARSFDVCVEEVSAGVGRTSGDLQVRRVAVTWIDFAPTPETRV